MGKFALPVPLGALAAVLAACASQEAVTRVQTQPFTIVNEASPAAAGGTAPTVVTVNPRAGAGRLDSLAAVPTGDGSKWRLGVRMDDGSTQVVDTLTEGVMLGRRVHISGDAGVTLVSNAPLQVALAEQSAATGGTAGAASGSTAAPALRTGFGRVETIVAVPVQSVVTGTPNPIISAWRIGVRMDDGSTQTLDTLAEGLSLGKRVQITGDGRIALAQ
ncbi:MAG: hypothetical protein ACT4P4_25670 [Betaproteobacteria bacterium]